jgi:hypothetical protein
MKITEILLVLIVAIYSIITANKWKDLNIFKRSFIIISILAAIIFAYNAYFSWNNEWTKEKIGTKYGEVQNQGKATTPILQIGDNGTTFLDFSDRLFNSVFKEFAPKLKIYVKNNKLYLTTIIRDPSGKVIAAIIDNEWEKNENVSDYDYNNDDNGFEVITVGDRNVCFQVDLKNGVAHIAGFFINEDGKGVCLANLPDTEFSIIAIMDLNKKHFPQSKIPAIFKYPRDRYLGMRAN